MIPPSTTTSTNSRAETLELEMRQELQSLLLNTSNKNLVKDVSSFWTNALLLCVHLVHHATTTSSSKVVDARYQGMAVRKLPLILLEDIMMGLSARQSLEFWESTVEPVVDDILLGDLLWQHQKTCHLQFLKVCNQLLSICRDSQNHVMSGKILLTLSKAFGVAEKSGTKPWGSFRNNHRVVGGVEDGDDGSLYHAFVSLQADLANPNQIQLADFLKHTKRVLSAMESTTCTSASSTSVATTTSTSPKLLPRQLASQEFRTGILTQFLIIATHLSSESASLKGALAQLMSRAQKLLDQDYWSVLELLLTERELAWRSWKKTKRCHAAAFAPAKVEPNKKKPSLLTQAGALMGDVNDTKQSQEDQFQLVTVEELQVTPGQEQQHVPSLETHLEPYVEALDPESGIEAEYHPKNDSIYSWRAMRLFRQHHSNMLHLVSHQNGGDYERLTRTLYQEEKGIAIPGSMPEEVNDDSSVEEPEDDSKSAASSSSVPSSDDNNHPEHEEEDADEDEQPPAQEDDKDDVELKDSSSTSREEAKKEDKQPEEDDEEERPTKRAKTSTDEHKADVDAVMEDAESASNPKQDTASTTAGKDDKALNEAESSKPSEMVETEEPKKKDDAGSAKPTTNQTPPSNSTQDVPPSRGNNNNRGRSAGGRDRGDRGRDGGNRDRSSNGPPRDSGRGNHRGGPPQQQSRGRSSDDRRGRRDDGPPPPPRDHSRGGGGGRRGSGGGRGGGNHRRGGGGSRDDRGGGNWRR